MDKKEKYINILENLASNATGEEHEEIHSAINCLQIFGSEPVDKKHLYDWFISSVGRSLSPMWSRNHISELIDDFIVIPKRTENFDQTTGKKVWDCSPAGIAAELQAVLDRDEPMSKECRMAVRMARDFFYHSFSWDQWISARERKPSASDLTENGEVLVKTKEDVSATILYYDVDKELFYNKYGQYNHIVSHWMPIPVPPV